MGKNEVIQKETKDVIRISNLPSKWGFPPTVGESEVGGGGEAVSEGEEKATEVSFL